MTTFMLLLVVVWLAYRRSRDRHHRLQRELRSRLRGF